MFSTGKGNPYDPKGASIWFRKEVRAAGLVHSDGRPKFTFHGLRHSTVSILHSIGVPVADIARIVGHSRPTTTMAIYADAIMPEDALHKALEAMAGQINLPTLSAPPVQTAVPPPPPQPVIEARPAFSQDVLLTEHSIRVDINDRMRHGLSLEESLANVQDKMISIADRAEAKAQALQLNQSGVAPNDIANRLKVPHSIVYYWLTHPDARVVCKRRPAARTPSGWPRSS